MGVFDRQVATAIRLINKNGATVTWRKMVPATGDNPAKPGAGTPLDFSVKICFFPNNELSLLTTLNMLKGTEVPSGRVYGLMASVPFIPALVDTLVGTPYGDLALLDKDGIDELNVNGQSILYTLRFAR